jgi:hypothetical protein
LEAPCPGPRGQLHDRIAPRRLSGRWRRNRRWISTAAPPRTTSPCPSATSWPSSTRPPKTTTRCVRFLCSPLLALISPPPAR